MTLLTETQVMKMLGFKTRRTWIRRRPAMVKAGLRLVKLYDNSFEHVISEEDLMAYIEARAKATRRNFVGVEP